MSSEHSEFELLIYWAMLGLLSVIPITIYLIILVKNNFKIKLDLIPVLKYLIISVLVFVPLFIISEKYLEYDNEIVKFLPNLLIYVIVGIALYAILTYVIDSKTKKFYNSIINEIIKKIK